MAQRFLPNNSVAEQILLNPTFANIDFADFQGLNMNLIDRNAEYTQNIANKRFEEMVQAQTKLLEDVQLHKRFDYLEKDLQNKLASVIDNAGNVQLSDNANFNKLNTSLISLKTDPQLKRAVSSSEQARKMQEILEKDPTLEKRLWDAPSVNGYRKFVKGETNDFELEFIYKNVDLTAVWDPFFSKLPADQQEILRDYGTYGLVQAKQEGRNVDELIKSIEDFENFTIKNNPEIVSHLERRGNYEKATNPNIDKNQFINDYIKESLRASASKFAGVSNTISSVGIKPDETFGLQKRAEDRMQRTQDQQDQFYAPYDFQGGILVKGNKTVKGENENNAFKQGVAAYLIPKDGKVNTTNTSIVEGKSVTSQSKKLVDPNSLYVTTVNGENFLKGNTTKGKPIDPIPVPSTVLVSVLNSLGTSTVAGTPTPPTPAAGMETLLDKYNLKLPTK
jgi:hypothetical protein